MGAPSVTIAFIERSESAISRGERGVIAMILKDTSITSESIVDYTIYTAADIPDSFSDANKEQIELALMGYQTAPKKILVHLISGADGYSDALAILATWKWDYLVCPTVTTDKAETTVSTWIKAQRGNDHRTYKAVLPDTAGDNEGIINVAGKCMKGSTTYTAEAMCARVAGIICGTPLTMSCTYAPLMEMTDCERLAKTELDVAVDAGKLVFMWDGEKVKVCRGVNSFQTTSADKGESFKKIKIVEVMDMIRDDITLTAQDSYIGKYANSYDNKCLLITAINAYFSALVQDGVLESGSCTINMDAQRNYFANKGGTLIVDGEMKKMEDCSDDEIKKANTGSQVFLRAAISILDAIEDIDLEIYI